MKTKTSGEKTRCPVIHKRLQSRYIIAEESLCGYWVQHKQTSYLWNKVNCKKCLEKKSGEKLI